MRPPRNFYVKTFQREAGMLSRVADSLYWMSRYLERAEHSARLVDVELQLWLDQSPEEGAGRWRFLLEALLYAGIQSHECVFDCVLHCYGSGKSAACARAVQLGDVGAIESAVS